jgi:hypothetical protein
MAEFHPAPVADRHGNDIAFPPDIDGAPVAFEFMPEILHRGHHHVGAEPGHMQPFQGDAFMPGVLRLEPPEQHLANA